jgi:hypothetical protein
MTGVPALEPPRGTGGTSTCRSRAPTGKLRPAATCSQSGCGSTACLRTAGPCACCPALTCPSPITGSAQSGMRCALPFIFHQRVHSLGATRTVHREDSVGDTRMCGIWARAFRRATTECEAANACPHGADVVPRMLLLRRRIGHSSQGYMGSAPPARPIATRRSPSARRLAPGLRKPRWQPRLREGKHWCSHRRSYIPPGRMTMR